MRCTQGCRGVKRDGVSSQRRGEKKGVHSGREGEAGRNNQIKQERALQKAGKAKRGGVGEKRMVCKKGPAGRRGGRERVLKGKLGERGRSGMDVPGGAGERGMDGRCGQIR